MQSPQVSQIPIRCIDKNNSTDVKTRDRIVALVESILALNAQKNAGHDKILAERQIAAADREIDKLVYELYGLTEEEIKIVEAEGSDQ